MQTTTAVDAFACVRSRAGRPSTGWISRYTVARAHPRRSLLIVTVIAVLVAGCGGDNDATKKKDADFKEDATAAATQTSQLGKDLGSAIEGAGSTTDAQLAKTFSDLTSRARAVVAKLRALEPPDKARQKVDDLAAALSTGAKDLAAIATAVRSSDAAGARTATQTLVSDSPAIKTANDALKAELRGERSR